MTDQPSEQAKKLACELANAQGGNWQQGHVAQINSSIYALALYIDKVDKMAREMKAMRDGPAYRKKDMDDCLRSLILPDEPDVLEEAMEAAWNSLPVGSMHWGKPFVQATRAELKKRGLTIAEEK